MDPEERVCKILQPRGTRGDVISTTEPETYYNSHNPSTTKSFGFHVWMAHSPWLVSRKVYLFRLPPLLLHIPRPRAPLASPRLIHDGHRPDFCPHPLPSANLHERIRGTKISFSVPRIKMVSFEAARQRKWKERFLHCRFLSLWLLIIHCADSVVPSFLTYEMRRALWVIKTEGKFRFLYIIDIFLNAFRKQDNGHTNTSKRIIRNTIINNIYNMI